MDIKEISGFVLLKENFEYLDSLSLEQRGKLLTALYKHFVNGVDENFDDDQILKIVFKVFKDTADRLAGNYIKTVEENRRRSESMRGNKNARKHPVEEPTITVSTVEQELVEAIKKDDETFNYDMPYDQAKQHFSTYFDNYLKIAGGDENLVWRTYNSITNNPPF